VHTLLTRFLKIREENRLGMFKDRMLKKIFEPLKEE